MLNGCLNVLNPFLHTYCAPGRVGNHSCPITTLGPSYMQLSTWPPCLTSRSKLRKQLTGQKRRWPRASARLRTRQSRLHSPPAQHTTQASPSHSPTIPPGTYRTNCRQTPLGFIMEMTLIMQQAFITGHTPAGRGQRPPMISQPPLNLPVF